MQKEITRYKMVKGQLQIDTKVVERRVITEQSLKEAKEAFYLKNKGSK